jgi:hypothetical protein
LLAFATIKPQLVLPLLAWLLLWAFSEWHQRQNFVWGFVSTMAILLAAAEYVLPGWIWRFRDAVIAYRQYNDGAESVLDTLITPEWGRPLSVLAVLVVAVLCWRFRRVPIESSAFNLMLALVLAVTVVIVPKAAPYNQVLLLPGFLLLVRGWGTLWQKSAQMRFILIICGLLIFWPWLAASALTIAWLFLPAEAVQNAWAVPLWTILAIPPTVVVLLASSFGEFTKASLAEESGPESRPPGS